MYNRYITDIPYLLYVCICDIYIYIHTPYLVVLVFMKIVFYCKTPFPLSTWFLRFIGVGKYSHSSFVFLVVIYSIIKMHSVPLYKCQLHQIYS